MIQERNHELLQRGGKAIVELIDALVAAKNRGVPEPTLQAARQLQRRAQWRLDFIASENSMGFHAPQEAARVLREALDFVREGQVALLAVAEPSVAPAPDAPAP